MPKRTRMKEEWEQYYKKATIVKEQNTVTNMMKNLNIIPNKKQKTSHNQPLLLHNKSKTESLS